MMKFPILKKTSFWSLMAAQTIHVDVLGISYRNLEGRLHNLSDPAYISFLNHGSKEWWDDGLITKVQTGDGSTHTFQIETSKDGKRESVLVQSDIYDIGRHQRHKMRVSK